jgi:hypothetical protein
VIQDRKLRFVSGKSSALALVPQAPPVPPPQPHFV